MNFPRLPFRPIGRCVAGSLLSLWLGLAVGAPGSTVPGADAAQPKSQTEPARERENYAIEIEAPESIAKAIRTQTFLGRWQRRDDYDPDQFAGIVERVHDEVQAILRAQGYFSGRVELTQTRARVRIKVITGARTTVVEAAIDITGPVLNQARLVKSVREGWALPVGSFFDSEAWSAGKRALVEALAREGYLRARIVDSEARVDVARTTVALRLKVDSGARIAFGDLHIGGLSRYPETLVRNLRTFTPGDPYTLDQLLAFQTRLRNAGYFSGASVLPDLLALERDPSAQRVPILVEIAEQQLKRTVLGVGFSTDEGPRGQIGYEDRRVFGTTWRLETTLIASARRQRAFANARSPSDPGGHFFGIGSRVERADVEGERTVRTNTYVGRGRRLGETETFLSLQYQVEQVRLDATAGAAATTDSRRALVLGYSWNRRRVDSVVDPRRGYTISAQVSGARAGLASDRSFVRFYGRAMRFVPMPADSMLAGGTLILLGELGWVAASARTDIPSENLFRAGGAQSVRGYAYQSLGVTEGAATVGGRYLAVASAEYQHPIREGLAGAVFYDVGNATDATDAGLHLVAGYGLGLRWRTPVGPINLDVAYGEARRAWRVHFSVGYTF